MSSEIKLVFRFISILALLGFTQVPIAEGEISWNGFLKQVGFNPPTVYEVSQTVVVLTGENTSPPFSLRCLDGDWMNFFENADTFSSVDIVTNPLGLQIDGIINLNVVQDAAFSKIVGIDGTTLGALQAFDYEVTATILCLSPSSLMTIGGEWQATDTTALIIGYSVLNAYWIAPIGIGIGVGIYLVKRKIE